MFEDLARHPRIAVTGPQRSGTTVAAQAIAQDTGHRFVDEFEFDAFDVGAWLRTLFSGEKVVVQCPHMFRYLVDLKSPEIFVVLMRRSVDDIRRSAERVGWHDDLEGTRRELELFGLTEGDPAAVKYEYWQSRGKTPHHAEVAYESLAGHALYIPAGRRTGFQAKQTAPVPGPGEFGGSYDRQTRRSARASRRRRTRSGRGFLTRIGRR